MDNILNSVHFVANESTRRLSFYGTEGKVKGAFYPKNEQELIATYNYLKINDIPFKIVGNGSNLLFSPKSEEIFVLSTKLMENKINFKSEKVYFSSAVAMPILYHRCYEKSLGGLEELSCIPGTLGGLINMNAGAYGKCIFDNLDKIKILQNGKVKTIKKEQVEYGYHKTNLNDVLILGGSIILTKTPKCEILKKHTMLVNDRLSRQPSGKCCGSVFKNPPEKSAGWLIEQCGLKGISKNGAVISNKHANFIMNQRDASFQDIYDLIMLCENCVYEKFNIKLEREVEII